MRLGHCVDLYVGWTGRMAGECSISEEAGDEEAGGQLDDVELVVTPF